MRKMKRSLPILAGVFLLAACSGNSGAQAENETVAEAQAQAQTQTEPESQEVPSGDSLKEEEEPQAEALSEKETIEALLDLKKNENQEWTYHASSDAWVLSVVSAVAYPEIPEKQGVSVCVPGVYVSGIDTDGDGQADVTGQEDTGAVNGCLVIDYDALAVSSCGQIYTASTAPVILNTGAAGYGSSTNTAAATTYAQEGYINVSCGNRGKQDTATDENGETYYTGDAPSCLVDQKAAARFVKYNILLGNLPGDPERLISTGGSGGGAHAVMFAATSNHPDFYEYEIEAGAVGVYKLADGSYLTSVTVDGQEVEISDGAWGCIAYSAITPLYDADMAMAFEYYLDADNEFNTPFQKQLAQYLAFAYMDYINEMDLSVKEGEIGFDLDGDGETNSEVALTIDYDPDSYPQTNGFYGTYLTLYLDKFQASLQWYLDNITFAQGWTWFDENGQAYTNEALSALTQEDLAAAFLEGRYTKAQSGMGPMAPSGMNGVRDFMDGGLPGGAAADLPGDLPDGLKGPAGMEGEGSLPSAGEPGKGGPQGGPQMGFNDRIDNGAVAENSLGDEMLVGTPDAGTTQAAGSAADSSDYATYEEMVAAYEADIAEVETGDRYGNNPVALYNPLNYIGSEGTSDPAWVRILMGAAEGDMSMLSSLNMEVSMLSAGIDAKVEWQWDGGHVPSEIFAESFVHYVDSMFAEHAGGEAVASLTPEPLTANGTDTECQGTDLTEWIDASDLSAVTFTLADAAAYRVAGASKATPGFDVIDYGQEDYVFGSREKDARHWDRFLLDVFKENADTLAPLFNGE